MALIRIVFGFTLLVAGVLLAIPLPEAGVPLLLIGLRMLGERYAWARRANEWVDARWSAATRWFHALPVAGKIVITAVLVGVAAAVVWFGITHL